MNGRIMEISHLTSRGESTDMGEFFLKDGLKNFIVWVSGTKGRCVRWIISVCWVDTSTGTKTRLCSLVDWCFVQDMDIPEVFHIDLDLRFV